MIKLRRLRRRLIALQIVKQFKGVDDNELRQLQYRLRLPMLKDRWRREREEKVQMIEKNRRSSDELLAKREDLHSRFLVAERTGDTIMAPKLKGRIEALDWTMNIGGKDDL